jgi:hypothetical protein
MRAMAANTGTTGPKVSEGNYKEFKDFQRVIYPIIGTIAKNFQDHTSPLLWSLKAAQ